MPKARLFITAVILEGRSQAEVARAYGVSPGWVSKLVAHYRLAGGAEADAEILTWLDDCTRYALSVTAHERVTGPATRDTFRATCQAHGAPASTLTDNDLVLTIRLGAVRLLGHDHIDPGRPGDALDLFGDSKPGHSTTGPTSGSWRLEALP